VTAPGAGYSCEMEETADVRCPYCHERVQLYVDPDTTGTYVEDCAVCCQPWQIEVDRTGGKLRVRVSRAQ
jgi:Cysteine-rich CPXCG